MTSRSSLLAPLVLAAVGALVLSGCGGDDDSKNAASGTDRSGFVEITNQGLAAVVDKHLGKRVKSYDVYADAGEESGDTVTQRTVEMTLSGGDPRDTFSVTVYAPGASEGEVVTGSCDEGGESGDPQTTVTCIDAPEGGNVTLTRFGFGLSEGNRKGIYLTASGSGPKDREVTASIESFTKKLPIGEQQLQDLLADPNLGWKTDKKFNKAGESLKVTTDEG